MVEQNTCPIEKAKTSSIEDFTIIAEIGKGAFSNVYKVRRKIDNQFYALKKVNLVSLSEKERDNSFNEIRLLATINNINVISYKDSFIDKPGNHLYLIMEYADNGDLEQRIQAQINKKEFLLETTVLSIFEQIIRGLKALHDKSIIHRDLKAANIFLFNSEVVKIGDMNVSKIIKKGVKNTQTGTPYYASPEIWENKPYDFKSDIWSLGCLCYEMAALKAPFRGTSMAEVYSKVSKGNFDPIPKQYSKELLELIQICLKVKSEERPNCLQLLQYIQKMKDAQPSPVKEISIIKKDTIKRIKLSLNLNVKLPMSRYDSKLRLRGNKERLKGIRRYYKNESQINQTKIQNKNSNDNNEKHYALTLNDNRECEDNSNEKARLNFNHSTNNIKGQLNFSQKPTRKQVCTELNNKQRAQIEKELGMKKISLMKKRLVSKELALNESKEKERSITPIKRHGSANPKLRLNKDLMNLTNENIKDNNVSQINELPQKPQLLQQPQQEPKDKAVDEAMDDLLQFNAEQSRKLAEKYLDQQRSLSTNTRALRNRSDNIRTIFSSYTAIQTEPTTSANNNKSIHLPQINSGNAPVYLHTKANNSVQMFDIFHNLVPDQHGKKIKKINLNHFNKKGYHKLNKTKDK